MIYGLVGCINTSIDFFVFAILTELVGIQPLRANIVSFLLGAVNSFIMNGTLTFRSTTSIIHIPLMLRFAIVTAACLAISSLALSFGLLFLPKLGAKAFSILVTFALGYLLYNRFVYFSPRLEA